jgi:hypothetical protein
MLLDARVMESTNERNQDAGPIAYSQNYSLLAPQVLYEFIT